MDQDLGSDWLKGKHALDHIRNERPCTMLYDSDKNGDVDHFPGIEGVKYMEKKYIWNWYNYEMWYYINKGWGASYPREWICVDAQYGSSRDKEYKNTGNIYMMWR